jgi:hypothetical protein
MDRRRYVSMALMAGLVILAAGVIVIATRAQPKTRPAGTTMESIHAAASLIRLRLDGGDSSPRRRELKQSASKLSDSPLKRALIAFADGNLEAAAREEAYTPFGLGLKGWILVELNRRPEAVPLIEEALKEPAPDWELRPLFEEVLKRAR